MDSQRNLYHGECAKSSHLTDENNEYAQSCLDAVMEAVWKDDVVGRLDMYRTYVLLCRTYVLLVRLTKVRR